MNVKNQHLAIFRRGLAALILLFAFAISFTANAGTGSPPAGMDCFSILDDASTDTHHKAGDTHKGCDSSTACGMATCSGIFLNQPTTSAMISFRPLSRILAPDDRAWREHPPSTLFRPPIL